MWLRRIGIIFALIIIVAGSSCSSSRQSVRRVFLPSHQEITLSDLAEALSSTLKMNILEDQDDLGLYAFVADWIGTPYRYGSHSKKGTDCSGFAYLLYLDVYEKNIGRSSSHSLMSQSKRVSKNDLKEGDLVFFNINNRRGGRASHVGVYLKDNKFVHASTRQGVIISSLNESYYSRTFIGGGRIN